MKKIKLLIFIVGFSCLTFKSEAQTSWVFEYGFLDVFSTNALQYVIDQSNITQTAESGGPDAGVSYWCPITNGTPASLTMKFSFPSPTSEVFLKIGSEPVYNFGGGENGTESLWGSTDGTNWIQLVNLPVPTGISADDQLSTNLPNSLLGANQIWIQDRMETSGSSIMAQFLRQDTSANTNNVFQLNANFSPIVGIITVPTISISGNTNDVYSIQYVTNISLTNWITLVSNIVLQSSPSYYPDTNSIGEAQRFYRVVAQ